MTLSSHIRVFGLAVCKPTFNFLSHFYCPNS